MRERNKCWVNNHYLELISPSLYLFCIAEEPEPLKRNRTHSLPFKMGLNLEKPSWNIILYLIILNNILKFGFKWISDHVAIFIFSESLFFLKIKLFLNHRGDSLFFFFTKRVLFQMLAVLSYYLLVVHENTMLLFSLHIYNIVHIAVHNLVFSSNTV